MNQIRGLTQIKDATITPDKISAIDSPSTGEVLSYNLGNFEWIVASGSGGLTNPVDYIDFNTAYSGSGQEGRIKWNSDDGTLEIGLPGGNVNNQIGQEILVPRRVKNNTASPMYNGQIVYISGGDGNNAYVALAKADAEATSAYTLAMLTEDIAAGQKGYATTFGLVRGNATQPINTNSYTAGTVVYLSATVDGGFTGTKTVAPNHLVVIGTIFRQHATEGAILVNIQNGYEMNELHDVLISGLANKDILQYESATSLWKNVTPTTALGDYFIKKSPSAIEDNLVTIGNATYKGLILKAHASQTANLQEWQNSSGTALISISSAGNFGIGTTPDTARRINSYVRYNTLSASSYGLVSQVAVGQAGSGDSVREFAGMRFVSATEASYNGNLTNASGGIKGIQGLAVHYGSATATSVTGLYIYAGNEGSGTTTNAYGIYLDSIARSAGTLTNGYGIYLANQSNATNNYSIYTNTGLNRLGDQLSVIGSADRTQFIIKANATQTGTTRLFAWQNSSATELGYIDKDGSIKTLGIKQAVATKGINYTLTATDEVVVFTASSTATLPAATGSGQTYRIVCRTGTLVIDANGSETIKGSLTQTIVAGEDLIITDTASGIWE